MSARYASISWPAINLHSRYSPLFTWWLSPGLSLSLSLSLHHCTDQSQCRTVDCLFGARTGLHPWPFSPVTGTAPPVSLPSHPTVSHSKPNNPLSLKQVVLGLSLLTVCSIFLARRSTTCTTTIQNFPQYPSTGFPWPYLIRAQVIGFK